MRKLFLPVLILTVSAIFSGCTKNKTGPNTNASVMFVNGCAGATGIYAKVNNNIVGPGNIGFFNNSGYQTVTAGTENISFYLMASGSSTLLTSGSPSFTAGAHYSIFVGGIITAPTFNTISDDFTAPTTGNAKIRLVNLSSDSLNCSYSVGLQTLDSNISYTRASSFHEVPAGNYTIKAGGSVLTTVSIPSAMLAAGKIYTVIFTGNQSGTGTSALTITLISNN